MASNRNHEPAPAGEPEDPARAAPKVWLPADFLSQLTHELKNHVAAAHAATYLLRNQGGNLAAEREQRWLEAVRQAVGGLRSTLDQIDTLDQIMTETVAPAIPVDLVPWVESIVAQALKKGPAARVTVRIRETLPGWWRLEGSLVGTALEVLVANALRFGPPDSTVWLDLRPGKCGLEIAVSDQGAGVSASEAGRLFTPFFQGANARGRGGAGLGLAIAQAAMRRLQGEVRYSHSADKGTVFCLEVPARREDA
ncbi:MAG: HAMP domain-containing histidine kinase [Verrucomicrobia bacterium]|nr:HAMP domain-containing histidine kinase [Verrucomicrobiota bacterium]